MSFRSKLLRSGGVFLLLLGLVAFLNKSSLAEWQTDFDPPALTITSVTPQPSGNPPTVTANSVTINYTCDDTQTGNTGCGEAPYKVEYYTDPDASIPSATVSGNLDNPALKGDPKYLDPYDSALVVNFSGHIATPYVVVTYTAKDHAGNPSTSPDSVYTFSFTPGTIYNVSGHLFLDINKDQIKNAGESDFSGDSTFEFTDDSGNATPLTVANGSFSIDLLSGNYTVSYISKPDAYEMTIPTGNPPSFNIQLGDPCSTGASNSASCSGGSITNLNFGLALKSGTFICVGQDCRIDTGITDPIPPPEVAACQQYASIASGDSNSPGILFSGENTPDFGGAIQGSPDPFNWVVAGTAFFDPVFSPVTPGVIRTSYDYMQTTLRTSGLTTYLLSEQENSPADPLTTCDLGSCNLNPQIPSGIYQVNGDLHLQTFTFPAPAVAGTIGKNYVFLVRDNLYIEGNIRVPRGSTATFSVKGTIYIAQSVGRSSFICPEDIDTTNGCDMDGFYSADQSVVLEGNQSDCSLGKDKQLGICGSIVANAGLGNGTVINQRDQCPAPSEKIYPIYYFLPRFDIILNAPQVIKHENRSWQELAP